MPDEPTQKTQPKKGKPIDIPIPTRSQVLGDLAKTAEPQRDSRLRKRRPKD